MITYYVHTSICIYKLVIKIIIMNKMFRKLSNEIKIIHIYVTKKINL